MLYLRGGLDVGAKGDFPEAREGQMVDGRWQMGDGRWQMADGRRRVSRPTAARQKMPWASGPQVEVRCMCDHRAPTTLNPDR